MTDFPGDSVGKESSCQAGDASSIPGWEDPLEKEMATHYSILAWEIPRTEHLAGYTVHGVAKRSTGSNQLGTQGDLTTDCLLHEL